VAVWISQAGQPVGDIALPQCLRYGFGEPHDFTSAIPPNASHSGALRAQWSRWTIFLGSTMRSKSFSEM
jgi:hypothetical protein